jgi:hypothetical protein
MIDNGSPLAKDPLAESVPRRDTRAYIGRWLDRWRHAGRVLDRERCDASWR